jgi:flagellar hook-associated protein 1 FlgK
MSLTQALATAVSGLRANQAGLSIVAANVANAETPGYARKTPRQITTAAGDLGVGVRVAAINRELDQYVQRQLRVEISGAAYASQRAGFYQRLQAIHGEPGSGNALETLYNHFTASLQALATSPDAASARLAVLGTAGVLTQQLNSMTADIQGLRGDAELGLADSIARANEALQRIAEINQQLGASSARGDSTTALLLDQRDLYIDQLTELMDVRLIPTDHGQINVFTNSGVQLVGTQAAKLEFDAVGTMTPAATWSDDPALRTVGTIKLKSINGGDVDLIAGHAIRSGKIASYLEMRDDILVEAQRQLDEIAAVMASALSDRTVAGSAATSGAQEGFDIDIGNLLPGNRISLTYTDLTTNTQRRLTFVRVDDPSLLPLADGATAEAGDKVIGINFSGGMASVLSQLNAALGASGVQFSNPSGSVLRVLDDGASNRADIDALSTTFTVTTLTDGGSELPFFLDAGVPYTGAFTGLGRQSLGLAGRIVVNEALIGDPSRLVVYSLSPPTAAGDAQRPTFMFDRLVNAIRTFSPETGIGTAAGPFSGSLPAFLRQVLSDQGQAADSAQSLKAGQDVVLNSLQKRFSETSGVNIDEEMANLLMLQNAYAANARVLSTVKEMIDMLMKL